MSALAVSHLVLWGLTVGLALVVLALIRQIGILHQRIAPTGALMIDKGPAIGDLAPVVEAEDLEGAVRLLGSRTAGRDQLLFFMSPDCPICKSLFPVLKSMQKDERVLQIILVSDGGRLEEHRALVRANGLSGFPYLLSAAVGLRYQVGKLPYGILIAEGRIAAKGLCNSREHLESLLHAKERGIGSVQDFVRRNGLAAPATPKTPAREALT